MKSQRVTFEGSTGAELAARLDRPDGEAAAYALFAHCFTCSKDLKAVGRISRALVERGYAVLRFDFTGLGESEGDFADTDFTSNVEDLLAAVEYLRREHQAPQLLVGHSLGGAAVLVAAGEVPEARAIATLGAPATTEHLRENLLREAPELEAAGEAEVTLAGRKFRIRKSFVEDLRGQRVLEAARGLGRPLLILHSPVDRTVPVENARLLYEAAKHPKSFVSLDQADHLLLADPADARYVAEVLAAWASRYLETADEEPTAAAGEATDEATAELPHGVVEVEGGRERYRQQIRAGRHELVADEPESVGGGDRGMTPYDLLLAGLGACTGMTLRMYADRKGWNLEDVRVRLRHERRHAKDCAECVTKKGRLDWIEREIEIRGELSDEERARLMEIADRCPVHRTLTSETVIRSREA